MKNREVMIGTNPVFAHLSGRIPDSPRQGEFEIVSTAGV